MFTTELILRLRERCPLFERRVGGTASFEVGSVAGVSLPIPHAFVVPVEETAMDTPGGDVLSQQVRLTFITIVCVSNTENREDGRGLTGGAAIEQVRRELLNAMIGWEPLTWAIPIPENMRGHEDLMPNSRADSVRYRGGSFLKMSDGRLWHQFEWSIDFYDGRCLRGETERMTATGLSVSGGQVQAVDQGHTTASTAVITYVFNQTTGVAIPATDYQFDQPTGVLELNPGSAGDGDLIDVMFDVEAPRYYELLRRIYAAYYPALLDAAGGDPQAITHAMYDDMGELPPDATVTWTQDGDPRTDPAFADGTPQGDHIL